MRKLVTIFMLTIVLLLGIGPLAPTTAHAYMFGCEAWDLWTLISCYLMEGILNGLEYNGGGDFTGG